MSSHPDNFELLAPPAAGRAVLPGRIGIVRNPRSHRNKAGAPAPIAGDDILVAAPASRADLTAALADFADQGVELIVVDGGDGTVRDLLTRGAAIFGEAWPRLMVVPKGKTNALALDLGMPARLTLEAALGAVPGARIERRRALRIAPIDGSRPAVHGFILATGMFNAAIDAAQVTHRLGAFQGLAVGLTTAIVVAKSVLGIGEGPWRALSPTRIVTAEGSEIPHSRHGRAGERWVAGFSTLTVFPLGMRPFAGSGQCAAAAIGCIVIDAPLRRVVARALPILRGAGGPRYAAIGVHHAVSNGFEIALAGRFILDGESFPPGTYRVELGPELEFLVP